VRTAAAANVSVTDSTGKEVFNGAADDKGIAKATLAQFLVTPKGRSQMTPHTVKATVGGKTAEAKVTMDKVQELQVGFGD
jgi:hypothetical protein